MNLSISGKGLDVGDALTAHIEEALPPAVTKYFENPIESAVTFSKRGHAFRADVQVHVSKRIIVQGLGEAGDAYAAFEEALEHVAKRLRRYKRRLKDHKQGAERAEILQAQQYVLAPEPDDVDDDGVEVGDQPVIVAETTAEIETLSVSEAVMRMDLSGAPALMFRSASHGGLNVVYVRADGNIGWVDPKNEAS